jgi:DNA-binding response OmpR family regulator
MGKRILVVDDDRHVTEILGRYLADEGYEAATAADAAHGVALAERWQPDLVVLDRRLPDAQGMEAFERIRRVCRAPIVMLTACDEEVHVVVGLEKGADDYITKPFSPRVVLARIRSVLRRAAGEGAEEEGRAKIRVGEIEIDRNAHEVHVGGREVALTPTEYRLLELLASRPGRIFPRAELLDALGADTDVFDRTLDKHVTNLRRKIERGPSESRYIKTVYGVGYKMRKEGSEDRAAVSQ